MTAWDFAQRLAGLAADTRLRSRTVVASPQGPVVEADGARLTNFASNDYLGLANHPDLAAAVVESVDRHGVGSGAAHFLSGHGLAHATLEAALADFVGAERALVFSSGYLANLAILSSLADRHTAIFADKLNHACLNDGALLAHARLRRYAHLDLAHLERLLFDSAAQRKIIATDLVFSMDGDVAPVPALLALADRYDALLVVDDAHGFGVLGANGRGGLEHFGLRLTTQPRLVYMATLGKAAGVAGAFAAGAGPVIDWIMQTARPYLFTTAAPPLLAHACSASLQLLASGQALRESLLARIRQFQIRYHPVHSWRYLGQSQAVPTAIHPIVIGGNSQALRAAELLRERGLWVPAIRPPTVPAGSSRLRISFSAGHTENDVERLIAALVEVEGLIT